MKLLLHVALLTITAAFPLASAQMSIPNPDAIKTVDTLKRYEPAKQFARILELSELQDGDEASGENFFLINDDSTCSPTQLSILDAISTKQVALAYVRDHAIKGRLATLGGDDGHLTAVFTVHAFKPNQTQQVAAPGHPLELTTLSGKPVVISVEGQSLYIGRGKIENNVFYVKVDGNFGLLDSCGGI